jgi:methionyl-tRNA formyltransferase
MPESPRAPRIVYGGDRQLGVDILRFLAGQQLKPLGLLLPAPEHSTHSEQLRSLCPHLDAGRIWYGKFFQDQAALDALRSLDLDYIICVRLSTLMPRSVLEIPRHGVLNMHPAYLPYNRGWHSAVWSILEGTPFGATLHFMSEKVDAGDIVHQKKVEKRPDDTGDSLYKRAMALEPELFREAWPALSNFTYSRTPQLPESATTHKVKDLAASGLQRLDLDSVAPIGDLIDRLRALTTNRLDEAAFFVKDGRKYQVNVSITEMAE